MTRRLVTKWRVYALGSLGLFLVVLVGKLAPHAAARPHTASERVRAWLARAALDGIEAIGWVVDRLPPPVSRPRASGRLKPAAPKNYSATT